jgi:guanine deaminase
LKDFVLKGHVCYSKSKNGVFEAHCPAFNMNLSSGIAPIRKYLDLDMKIGFGSDVAGGEFFGSFEEGYDFDAVMLEDTSLVHPQELSVLERLERAVYLGLDTHGIRAKYAAGEQIALRF